MGSPVMAGELGIWEGGTNDVGSGASRVGGGASAAQASVASAFEVVLTHGPLGLIDNAA